MPVQVENFAAGSSLEPARVGAAPLGESTNGASGSGAGNVSRGARRGGGGPGAGAATGRYAGAYGAQVLHDQFANYVIQRALTIANATAAQQLVEVIRPHLAGMRNTSGGRRIATKILKRFPMTDLGPGMNGIGQPGGHGGHPGGHGGGHHHHGGHHVGHHGGQGQHPHGAPPQHGGHNHGHHPGNGGGRAPSMMVGGWA